MINNLPQIKPCNYIELTYKYIECMNEYFHEPSRVIPISLFPLGIRKCEEIIE